MSQRLTAPSRRIVSAALLTLIIVSNAAFARIRNVPFDNNTIQAAIDAAQPGDTILVQPGNYMENLNLNGKSLTIGSLFLTTGQERYVGETVINGGWNGRSAVRMAAAENGLFAGFTIQNDSSDFGGGVYMRGGSPTLSHLVVQNCKAARNGGALYATGGAHPIIRNVTLRQNVAFAIGGAMSVFGGAFATIENSVIYDNYAGHVGGALHVNDASATLRGCTIVRNAALHSGGGIYLTQGAIVEATDCIFFEDEPDEVWILAGFMGTTFTASFCDIDGLEERIYAPVGSDLYLKVGNIPDDPGFTDLGAWDLTLAAGSPCIDAGHYESTPDPDGTRRDIGNYYFRQQQGGQRVRLVPGGYNTIQRAIEAANNGDVVFVRPGTYRENVTFSGKAITVASRTLPTGETRYADSTIIDAAGRGTVVSFVNGEGATAILDGFGLRGGAGTLVEANIYRAYIGGGILCRGTSPLIKNCIVRANELNGEFAPSHGGGAACTENSQAEFKNVRFIGNSADYGGGVAVRSGSSVIFNDVVIDSNTATAGDDSWGGGIWCFDDGEFTMDGGSISYNSSAGGGAIAMTVNAGSSSLSHVALVNNTGFWGAVMYGGATQVILDHVTIDRNGYHGRNDARIFNLTGRNAALNISNSIIRSSPCTMFSFTGNANVPDHLAINYSLIEGGFDAVAPNDRVELEYAQTNFDADPGFVNPDAGNYHLAQGSPCIDAGDPAFERDPDGTRSDIGALYYLQVIERDPATLRVPQDYYTIQSAIDASMNLDTIIVAAGRYAENLDYHGKNIVVASEYLHNPNPRFIRETVIDGGGTGPCAQFTRNEVFNTRLIGFTLTNGSAREGGGVFCFRAHPTIANCVIVGNSARDGGGGIYCYGATPTLVNLTIVGNDGGAGGGAMHLRNLAQPHITNSIIRDNVGEQIAYSADRDMNTVYIRYCDIEGAQNGIHVHGNGAIEWEPGNFDADPRFVNAEAGDYSLTENSPCIDAGDPAGLPDPDETRADVGALAYDSRPVGEEFSILMTRGWNLIGSPVLPPEPAMTTVWSGLVAEGRLLMLKDQNGRFFQPARGFNNVPPWDAKQGYMVKLAADAALTIRGETLPPEAPIPLRQGWSFISYQPPDPVSPVDGFAGIVEQLVLVKDGVGRFYMPAHNFNSIPELHRGSGYKVQTALATELIWGEVAQQERSGDNKWIDAVERVPQHFASVAPTGEDMSLLIEVSGAESGEWEIGVFIPDGLCVGAGVAEYVASAVAAPPVTARMSTKSVSVTGGAVTADARPLLIGVPIRGDDATSVGIDGAQAGEALTIRVWDGDHESIVAPVWKEGAGSYSTDGFALASLNLTDGITLPKNFSFSPPYPNPFNGVANLSYSLPEAAMVRLSVFDLAGREIAVLVAGEQPAGSYQLTWNSENLASGLYFVRLDAGAFQSTWKVTLLR